MAMSREEQEENGRLLGMARNEAAETLAYLLWVSQSMNSGKDVMALSVKLNAILNEFEAKPTFSNARRNLSIFAAL